MSVIVAAGDEPAEEARDRGDGDHAGRERSAEGALLPGSELSRGRG